MEPLLFKYIWHNSRREQMIVLSVVLLSLPFYFVSLSLPKSIVNEAIEGHAFENGAEAAPMLRFTLPFSSTESSGPAVIFDGFLLSRMDYLFALSGMFLLLVCLNGLFKFQINTLKGRMGERLLRRLRFQLLDRVLRFPPSHYRKIRQAEVASMVKDEVEPLGGFIGDAFVQPVFLGGMAITAVLFILLQNAWLALVAVSVVAIQFFIMPRLRNPILELGKKRQIAARHLAGRVGEIVDGAADIRVHGTSNYERAEIWGRLGHIFDIRYEIYRRKFFVKFLNNFMFQVTPFLFYVIGGYFAINGVMDVGSVVAALLAYNQLPSPVKDLISWDQERLDVQIKYEQVIEQFEPDGLTDPSLQEIAIHDGDTAGDLVLSNVSLIDESGARVLSGVSTSFGSKEHVAVIGGVASGAEALGQILVRLIPPTGGKISLNGRQLGTIPESTIGRQIGYAAQETYLFPASIRQNVAYSLNYRATYPPQPDRADASGAREDEDFEHWLARVLSLVDLDQDIYEYGLRGAFDPQVYPDLVAGALDARRQLRDRLHELELDRLIEPFDPHTYNRNATLAQNLLFGASQRPDYKDDALSRNALVRDIIRRARLEAPLLKMGHQIAQTMVELFHDLPADHPFFEQFSFVSAEDLPEYRAILMRCPSCEADDFLDRLSGDCETMLLNLPFRYIEARHRLGIVTPFLEQQIVEARSIFAEELRLNDPDAVSFYDPDTYNLGASIQDNILMGRISYGQARARERVLGAMSEIMDQLGLRKEIFKLGLDYHVGSSGRRLTSAQRQKIGLARALIKRPDYLVVNGALSILDDVSHADIAQRVIAERSGSAVIWMTSSDVVASGFERRMEMDRGVLRGAAGANSAEVAPVIETEAAAGS